MKLSIIILNYKQADHLRQLLRNLPGLNLPYKLEVFVVDNGSSDNSAEVVRRLAPTATFIRLPKNVGYAAGNNVALRQATGDYILILNPDISISPGAIETMVDYIERHPRVGMVGPRLTNPDGSTQLSGSKFMSFWVPLWRRSTFGHWPGPRRALENFFYRDWDRTTSRPVGWLIGAVLLLRRGAFIEAGHFDERFFLYFEDVDYCRRFWHAGWEVHYVAEAAVVHYHSRTSAVNPGVSAVFSYATRLHIKSWLRYFLKYRTQPKPPHSL